MEPKKSEAKRKNTPKWESNRKEKKKDGKTKRIGRRRGNNTYDSESKTHEISKWILWYFWKYTNTNNNAVPKYVYFIIPYMGENGGNDLQ